MSFFRNLFGKKSPSGTNDIQNAAQSPTGLTPGTPADNWLLGGLGGYGKPLTERQIMGEATVYACVSLLSGALASMPLHIYRENGDGRERVRNHLWNMLNEQMSTRWLAAAGWEFAMQSLLLHGDAFFRIERPSRYTGQIDGLTPVHPQTVDVRKQDGRLIYLLYEDGGVTVLDQDDVLHIPGAGFDGKRGVSQIAHVLRRPVNIAIDAGEQTGAFLGDGMRPDLALTSPKETRLDEKQIDNLRTQWRGRYNGITNSGAPVVLTGGMDLKQITMSAVDAQLLETRKLQAEQIAQIFGVPPHMIGMTEKTTSWGSGIEQMSISFVKYTMQRHLVKFEQEINRKSLKGSGLFCEFNTKGLERGDLTSRNESYRIALGRAGEPGWMTANEIRKAENLPPVEGGDTLYTGNTGNPDEQTEQQPHDPPAGR